MTSLRSSFSRLSVSPNDQSNTKCITPSSTSKEAGNFTSPNARPQFDFDLCPDPSSENQEQSRDLYDGDYVDEDLISRPLDAFEVYKAQAHSPARTPTGPSGLPLLITLGGLGARPNARRGSLPVEDLAPPQPVRCLYTLLTRILENINTVCIVMRH